MKPNKFSISQLC